VIGILGVRKAAAGFSNASVAIFNGCLPVRSVNRKAWPSLRFRKQRTVTRDITFRSIGVAVSDVANRQRVI
jgi:hypothetical protein